MSEWQQAPMTPHPETQAPVYQWYADLPISPTQRPPTPMATPVRPATGLELFLESTSPPPSPTPSNGSRANSNVVNQDMNTGRFALASPPRSLLSRLFSASQEEGD